MTTNYSQYKQSFLLWRQNKQKNSAEGRELINLQAEYNWLKVNTGQGCIDLESYVSHFFLGHPQRVLHQVVGFTDQLHVTILNAIVYHLYKVSSSIRTHLDKHSGVNACVCERERELAVQIMFCFHTERERTRAGMFHKYSKTILHQNKKVHVFPISWLSPMWKCAFNIWWPENILSTLHVSS